MFIKDRFLLNTGSVKYRFYCISISKNYSVSSLFSLIDGNRGIRHMDLSLFDV
jgi:hypothetical protein